MEVFNCLHYYCYCAVKHCSCSRPSSTSPFYFFSPNLFSIQILRQLVVVVNKTFFFEFPFSFSTPMQSLRRLFIPSLFFSAFFTAAFSDDVTAFGDCNRTFSCGDLSNIAYPFTGGDRPDYCGLPAYKLTCSQPDNITFLTHNSIAYRVLRLDPSLKTLTISREDFFNTTCPNHFANSTFDSNYFSLPAVGLADDALTLFYGCNSTDLSITPHNLFHCDVPDFRFSDAYYLIGPVPSDPNLNFLYCTVSVAVPVARSVVGRLAADSISLDQALNEGFTVHYDDPFENTCSACAQFGGYCGFDSSLGHPYCMCGDEPCSLPATAPSPLGQVQVGKGGSKGTSASIVLPIVGAVLAGIGFGWLVFYCRQRRKRLLVGSGQSSIIDKKELQTTPLTNKDENIISPSVVFAKSVPSYPSTLSEFGRDTSYFGAKVFSYTELEEATENFAESRELGDGGFGAVYYGKLADGRIVAVKRLYENNYKRVEHFMNEVEILTRLRHSNLVTLYGCTSKESRELLLVYEYVPNGTVADRLHGKRANSRLLSWPVRLNIAIETANALAYLHASDIIHRDVKTTNILLYNDFHVKVADFGLVRLFPNDATHVSTAPQGIPGYVDPDYYQSYQLTEKSDVYSFGVVLMELISSLQAVDTNRNPNEINLSNMAINKIQNHTLHELVDPNLQFEANTCVKRMITLVAELAFRCLQQEKDMRPSMQEVLDTLLGIKNGVLDSEKVQVLSIIVDDGHLLKDNSSPFSPDSVTNQWASGSTKNSSG